MSQAKIKVKHLPDAPKPTKAVRYCDPREKERQQRLAEHRELNLKISEGKTLCFWDKARVSKLHRLWNEGFSVKYITREVAAPSVKVTQKKLDYEIKCGRIKARRKRLTKDEISKIMRMKKAGMKPIEIAKDMRVSACCIRKVIKRVEEKQ